MRSLVGIILVLLGGAIVIYGVLAGLAPLRGLYEGATNDAMGMPPTAETDASKLMIRAALIGACGVPLLLAGSILLKISIWQRLSRAKRAPRSGR